MNASFKMELFGKLKRYEGQSDEKEEQKMRLFVRTSSCGTVLNYPSL